MSEEHILSESEHDAAMGRLWMHKKRSDAWTPLVDHDLALRALVKTLRDHLGEASDAYDSVVAELEAREADARRAEIDLAFAREALTLIREEAIDSRREFPFEWIVRTVDAALSGQQDTTEAHDG